MTIDKTFKIQLAQDIDKAASILAEAPCFTNGTWSARAENREGVKRLIKGFSLEKLVCAEALKFYVGLTLPETPSIKPLRTPIKVLTPYGEKEVLADVYEGVLAIHDSNPKFGEWIDEYHKEKSSGFTITHVQSGRSLGRRLKKAKALHFVSIILKTYDRSSPVWQFQKGDAVDPALVKIVSELL